MREDIKICLDEIDVCYDRMDKPITKIKLKSCDGWVRKQKNILKELDYKGKLRRKPQISNKKG